MDDREKSTAWDPSISRRRKLSVVGKGFEAVTIVVVIPMVGWAAGDGFDAIVFGILGVLISLVTWFATADFVRGIDDA
jgi:hypothetical protein